MHVGAPVVLPPLVLLLLVVVRVLVVQVLVVVPPYFGLLVLPHVPPVEAPSAVVPVFPPPEFPWSPLPLARFPSLCALQVIQVLPTAQPTRHLVVRPLLQRTAKPW